MSEITEIRPGARGSRRRRIFIDCCEWRSLPAEVVRELGLRAGQQHEPDSLERRAAEIAPAQAWERALRLLNYRERGSGELRQRLLDDGYEPEVAEAAVARALELGFIDDRRFAEGLVRGLTAGRRQGRRRVAASLAAKGVDENLAAELLATCCDPDSELERARATARTLVARRPMEPRRLAARLASRGFEASVAWSVARELAGENGHASDEG